MGIVYHRLVAKDVGETMRYYREVSGVRLADEFFAELSETLAAAERDPTCFHFDRCGLRRANLRRFPFHFLFRARREAIYVLVVRHHKRRPDFGLGRSWR